ncbi:oligopeptide transporter [Rhypophila decipiens]
MAFQDGIAALAQRSSRAHVYPRPDLVNLNHYLGTRSAIDTPVETDDCSAADHFAVIHDITTGQIQRFAPSSAGLDDFVSYGAPKSPSIIFMRGFGSPQWLNAVGNVHGASAELYRRHLDVQAFISAGRNLYSSPSLPSSAAQVFQLTIPTICSRNVGASGFEPDDLRQARHEESEAMIKYFKQLRNKAKPADSVVRDCKMLSKELYIIEQTISIEVGPSQDGWRIIAWLDSGRDLSQSITGPWSPLPGTRSWETYFFPVISHHNTATYQPLSPTRCSEASIPNTLRPQLAAGRSDSSTTPRHTEEKWVAAQNISLLPFQYGGQLDREIARQDALYALTELFQFAASAEAQLLNLVQNRVENEMSLVGGGQFGQYLSISLMNLKYIKVLLTSHAQGLGEIITVLTNRHALEWPRIDSAVAEKAAVLLLADLEYLKRRNEALSRECEQGMATLANMAVLEESRRSVDMSRTVQRLTVIGTIFIPLSFVCSVWGMNVEELGTGSQPMWMWIVSALPVVLFSYLVYNWEMSRNFTVRAVVLGLLIGLLVNISNTYYGLRVGAGSQMSMISALLGFIIFKLVSTYGQSTKRLGPAENVLLTSVATATGCMPLTAGTIGVIPALEYIIGSDENGPLPQSFGGLVIWAFGLSFFGIIFTALLREPLIERERRLPWPGASATAHLIRTLHGSTKLPQHVDETSPLRQQPTADSGGQSITTVEPLAISMLNQTGEIDWKAGMNALFGGAAISGIISVILFFIPTLHQVPIFGHGAATTWLWTLDLSPGFFGQGIIMGPAISLHMLLGAILGWGVLSPYAKHRGWAPGDVGDWSTGSRGWIIWISLASLLADAFVKLCWLVLRPVWRKLLSGKYPSHIIGHLNRYLRWKGGLHRDHGYTAIPDESTQAEIDESITRAPGSPTNRRQSLETRWAASSSDSATSAITPPILGLAFVASLGFCTLAVNVVFGDIIPWFYTPLAIALSLPMAAVGIRSIAETDYNPESAIISQLVFAMLVPGSMPFAIVINLISAGMTVAAANQAGDLAYDLKVGSLIGAHPDAQIYGQIIGSIFGSLVSCAVYRLYSSQYTIPGPLFPVPSAYLVLSTARLLLGHGLPEGVFPFVVTAALLSTACTAVKIRYEDCWWQNLVPSGVSVAMGE